MAGVAGRCLPSQNLRRELNIPLPVAAGNLDLALRQSPIGMSTIGGAEAKPFSPSSLLRCYHQENEGNAINPRSADQAE